MQHPSQAPNHPRFKTGLMALNRCLSIIALAVLLACLGAASSQEQEQAQELVQGQKNEKKKAVKRFTGRVVNPKKVADRHARAFIKHGRRMAQVVKSVTPPAAFDCVQMGWVPPIRDQGSCGSCYLVSACDAMTCAWIKAGYQKSDDSFKISDQYGMDCLNVGGCGGGDEGEVIGIGKDKGFPAERYVDATGQKISDYPGYDAASERCRVTSTAKYWKLADYGYVASGGPNATATVADIKAALMTYGVLSIALDAGGDFGSYDGTGVISRLGNSIDHAITLTGWDDEKKAVKLRNQWSTSYGAQGYAWLSYDAVPNLVEVLWLSAGSTPALVLTVPNVSIDVGKPVTLAASATGGAPPYKFATVWGDGAADATLTHTYTTAGVYKVTVACTDSAAGAASANCTVTVGAPPSGLTIAVPDVQGAVGSAVKLTPNVAGGQLPYTYTVTWGDGNKDAQLTHTYTSPGLYNVSVTVADASGNTSTGICAAAIVGPGPGPGPGPTTATFTLDSDLPAGSYYVLPTEIGDLKLIDLIGKKTLKKEKK